METTGDQRMHLQPSDGSYVIISSKVIDRNQPKIITPTCDLDDRESDHQNPDATMIECEKGTPYIMGELWGIIINTNFF